MKLTGFALTILASGVFLSTAARAQVEQIDLNASPLKLRIGAAFSDNINPTIDEESEAYGVIIAPQGKVVAKTEGAWYMLDYDARLEEYSLSDDSAFIDDSQSFNRGRARLLGRFFLAEKWFLDAEAEHLSDTQKYATGISSLRRGVLNPDEFSRNTAAATLVYGSDTSKRAVSLKLAVRDWDFDDVNAYSALFDVQQTIVEVNLAARQSAATRWLARFEAIEDDYDSVLRDDSEVYRLLFGIEWKPTGKSTLEALIGAYQRDFDSQDTNTGLSWSIEYKALPRDDLQLSFNSARFSDVSRSEITTDTVRQEAYFDVKYLFSEQWHFGLGLELLNSEFNEVDATTELDEFRGYLNAQLHVNKHNSVVLRLDAEDVSSDNDLQDFDQTRVSLDWRYEF